jgi:hypothetical protein
VPFALINATASGVQRKLRSAFAALTSLASMRMAPQKDNRFLSELCVFAEEAFHSFRQLSHVQVLFRSPLNRTRKHRYRPTCLMQKEFYTLATHLISIMNSGDARR